MKVSNSLSFIILLSLLTPAFGFAPTSSSVANSTRHSHQRVPSSTTALFDVMPESKQEGDVPPKGVAALVNAAVGSVVFAGGVMGFVKAGSKPSLIAGSTFGGLLMAAGALSKRKRFGNMLGSGVAGMLAYVMAKKFVRSGKFVPSGLICSLSFAAVIVNLVELWRTRKQ